MISQRERAGLARLAADRHQIDVRLVELARGVDEDAGVDFVGRC